ncbi:MAG: C10 family peptidase, partial [Bacteroidales bacterium]|nr:C10 family peptidase [Bacteroidales bacterium]
MKRYLLVGLLVLSVSLSFAKKVEIETAKRVGKAFYYEQLAKNDRSTSLEGIAVEEIHTLKTSTGEDFIYIMNMEPQGFVLVSGDDIFRPVLGYGFDQSHNADAMNQNFKSWTQSYIDDYEYCVNNGVKSNPEFENEWVKYNTSDVAALSVGSRDDRSIEPLLTCLWNQDAPYNMLCPEDESGPGGHVYAGCVATAMSMIMYHYKYPEHGEGSHTHYYPPYGSMTVNYGETYWDWNAMMDEATGSSYDTKYAIAELQYHCGVAVNMMYGGDGSGAYSFNVPNAIKTYFTYDQSATHQERAAVASWDAWMDILYGQLDAGQPMYYSGQSTDGGHAFVCDAYDDNEMFHYNFGWSGSGNGFYALTGTGAVGGFNSSQAIVKNFIPDQSSTYPYYCSGAKELSFGSGSITDGSGPIEFYANNSDCSWLIQPKSEFDSISKVKIYFEEMDLESGADMLTIYNGATTDSEIAGQYSGSDIPSTLTINNSHVLITFESDDNDASNTGFRLEYKTVAPTYCSMMTEFTDATGTFTDGSEDKYYADGTVCQFKIAPQGANSIILKFNEFDLADEGDRIEVYQMNPNQLLETFKGGDTPTEVTGNSGEMMLIFRTDDSGIAQGFEVEYTIDIAVGATQAFEDLRIFPNPADSQLEISFNMESANTADIQLMDITGKVV